MNLITNRATAALLLFLISFFLYLPSLRNDFVWDDIEVIQKSYHNFKASRINTILFPEAKRNKTQRYYRPIVFVSMVTDRELWGINPFGFHLSNLLLNSISTLLLYFLLLLIFEKFSVEGKESLSFFSALLFAAYPMHVESVSWIAGRTDILCGIFFILAFILHIESYHTIWLLILTALSFSLSLLSKEVALSFPVLAISFDLLARRIRNPYNILRYTVYISLALLYVYLRGRVSINLAKVASEHINQIAGSKLHFFEIIKMLKVLSNSSFFYISKLVFPFDFNAFIASVPNEFYYLVFSITTFLLLLLVTVISVKHGKGLIAFCIIWIFVTLAPSAIVSVTNLASAPLAERYLYIPSAGYCMIAGYVLVEVAKRSGRKMIAFLPMIILISFYLFFTLNRQDVWKDNLSLWKDTSFKSFYHALPHSNYGFALEKAGRTDEAIKQYEIALDPSIKDSNRGRAITATNLGVLYLNKEDYVNAEKCFEEALKYDPTYGRPYYHIGLLYYIKGESTNSPSAYREAARYLEKTFKIYRSYPKADLLLAKVYLSLGYDDKAKQHAKKALQAGLSKALSKEAVEILNINDDKSNQ
jgi:tetratricopeptide (TPR) repeat protein